MKGGYRPGSGRKPKADEISMIEKMDASKAPSAVWDALAKKVDEGNVQAIKCWLQYRYGMPRQMNEQVDSDAVSHITFEIVDSKGNVKQSS